MGVALKGIVQLLQTTTNSIPGLSNFLLQNLSNLAAGIQILLRLHYFPMLSRFASELLNISLHRNAMTFVCTVLSSLERNSE